MEKKNAQELWEGVQRGEYLSLAKFITLLVRKDAQAHALAKQFHKTRARKRAHVLGFSGSGGVGKSTLIAQLVLSRTEEYAIGVLYVDPPALSGGAVLGDRIRLQSFKQPIPARVYARSIVAYELYRGVTRQSPAIIDAMIAAGNDFVFVESVGMGQKNEDFRKIVDTHVYVASPAMGDAMQVMKGGSIETGHIIALNKCDAKGADIMMSLLQEHWGGARYGTHEVVPVLRTNALKGEGVAELWDAIYQRREKITHKGRRKG